MALRDQEWLDNLKVGDKVVIQGRDRDSISTVERFTKTLIITTGERKFRKNGTSPGSVWNNESLAKPTQQRVDAINQADLASLLNHFTGWKQLSLETLRKIHKLTQKIGT